MNKQHKIYNLLKTYKRLFVKVLTNTKKPLHGLKGNQTMQILPSSTMYDVVVGMYENTTCTKKGQ